MPEYCFLWRYSGIFCAFLQYLLTNFEIKYIVIADKIILMHTGKIVEMGTKEELLNTDSEFNKLYSFQISTKEQFL